jgi:tRNA (guanine6-N2)-methyltransferase
MQYFARVTAGLETVAWREMEQMAGVHLIGFGHRRIDFTYEGPPTVLLGLKSVDDVYLFITQLDGLDRTRASLRMFQELKEIDFTPAVAILSAIREMAIPPTYGITASHLGKRNYSRYDVEDATQVALSEHLPWQFIPNRPGEEAIRDIEFRILIEEEWALVGVRLNDIPLHRRPYKVASRPGSLKAPVAYCLAMLAGLKPADVLLDPTCGAGTILIEAANFIKDGGLIGIDIEPDSIQATRHNGEAAGLAVEVILNTQNPLTDEVVRKGFGTIVLIQRDINEVSLPAGTVQAVITNLPWGKQVEPDTDLFPLYAGVVNRIDQVLDSTGRAVILTDRTETLTAALQSYPHLTVVSTFQISLFGSHPTIHLIYKG